MINELLFNLAYIGGAVSGVCGVLFIGGVTVKVLNRFCRPFRRAMNRLYDSLPMRDWG